MLRAESVNHVSILVNDLYRSKAFYVEMLSMKEIPDGSGNNQSPQLCRLDCGGMEVTLFQRPKPFGRDFVEENGFYHHSFRMNWDDISRLARDLDGLRGSGYTLCEDASFTTTVRDDRVLVRLLDPDGNRLELVGQRPGAL